MRVLATTIAVLLASWASPGSAVLGCSLPADPYVVLRVSKDPVGAINSPSQFVPQASVPGTTDPLTGKPYSAIQIPEDTNLHFITLWDLTQGGQDTDPLGKLPATMQLAASMEIDKFSNPGEFLLPIHYYFDKIAGGKLQFKLGEMIARSGRSFEDPLAVVDFGGFVKDGEYQLVTDPVGSGPAEYLWNDQKLEFDNAPFDKTFRSNRFPKSKAQNNNTEMVRPGPRGGTQWVVEEAAYEHRGVWELESYSNEYHMDVENIGANIGSEENPPANDPRVANGDYVFNYHVPSDPLAYHSVIGSALIFLLKDITWTYKEKLYEFSDDLDEDGQPIKDANGVVQRSWKFASGDNPNELTGKINVFGRLARSTNGLSAESRVASTLIAVTDQTPPSHVHFVNKRLAGTTGETLSEAASALGQPDKIRVQVIDNNPFAIRGVGQGAVTGAKFKPADLGLDLYYSFQAYNYGTLAPGALPVDLTVTPKFVWAKANTSIPPAGNLQPISMATYKQDGTQVNLASDGKDADAVYSIATYEVPIAAFEEPMGWHFAATSSDWGLGRKLKILAAARDGTAGNQNPPADKLPTVVDSTAPSSQDEGAAKDTLDASSPMEDKTGLPVPAAQGVPAFSYPSSEHPSADCPADKLGSYAYIDVHDNDKPIVYLRVTDTKYDKKVVFGNRYAGDLRWQRAQGGLATPGNREAVGGQKPYSDDEEVWDFDAVYGGANGYAQQITDMEGSDPVFKPSEYAKAGPGGTKFGYWCDEDIPLVFDVFARDNINWREPKVPGAGWGITNGTLTVTSARDNVSDFPELNPPDSWLLVDSPTSGGSPLSPAPWPQHIFRNPNQPAPNSGDCRVEVEVADNATSEGGGIHRRKLVVRFHVMDNKLKIQSLEETRVRSSSGN